MKSLSCSLIAAALFCLCWSPVCSAQELKITVMQDQKKIAEKYKPLFLYLEKKGFKTTVVEAKDYRAAARLFSTNSVDAMFSGSGVAGVFIIKKLAVPLVRPVDTAGRSTYWAVVIAPKGSPRFAGTADYFTDKKVVFTSLASSGEFYYQSLMGHNGTNGKIIPAPSHGDALIALDQHFADVAIIKNRVWDDLKGNYPALELVGEDKGQNPDNTLIVSAGMPATVKSRLSEILLSLEKDTAPEALAVKQELKIKGFIRTTENDFSHTMELLNRVQAPEARVFSN